MFGVLRLFTSSCCARWFSGPEIRCEKESSMVEDVNQVPHN